MRSLAWMAFGLFVLSCGGGGGSAPIPQAEACAAAAQVICSKAFSCAEFALYRTLLGGTEEACRGVIVGNCALAGVQCAADQTYHGDKAAQCRDGVKGASCMTLAANLSPTNLTAAVPACSQVCTSGADAGSGG